MRHLPILVTVTVLIVTTACSNLSKATIETLGNALYPKQGQNLTREELNALPFAVLKLETAQYGSAYFALGRIVDGQRYWASTSGQVLVESHGLVRRSTGFPSTLEGTQFIGNDPFVAGLHKLQGGEVFLRSVDWHPGYRFGVILNCRFSKPLDTTLDTPQERRHVRLIEEELHSNTGIFTAKNRYWYLPEDGTVLRAEQQLTPEERVIITYVQKPEKQS